MRFYWPRLKQGGCQTFFNLVLLKHGADDLYGRWIVCEIGIMALADPSKIIGTFGITRNTVMMQYATGHL
jgi:hypothetical protein